MLWIITGRKYADTPSYFWWDADKKYPEYSEVIDQQTWGIEAESLTAAEMWLMENHPDYFMGSNITNRLTGNDLAFSCNPIPCGDYPKGTYETNENRRKYVAWLLEQMRERVKA